MDGNKQWCLGLYEAEAARMLLYGRALGLSHWEAEDLLQETFLALWRLSCPPEQPLHYALRAFRHRALNYRRGLWRRLARELESRRWFERGPDESARERAAMRGLADLPLAQREVIVLKIWHDCTFEEIGRLQGVSAHTAAGRYRYGLQKLRSFLERSCHESDPLLREPVAFLEAAASLGGAEKAALCIPLSSGTTR